MKILYIFLLLAVSFVSTVVTYYRKCYEEFSVCLITNTDDPYFSKSNYRLDQTSANNWCKDNSSSLASITNETVQSALAAFINDSSAKLNSDIITNGYRFKPDFWEWTNGKRSDINPVSDDSDFRYAYAVPTRSNATLIAYIATSEEKFICSSSLNDNLGCQVGYEKHNHKCYKKHNEEVTWFTARSRCLQERADIATFENNDLSLISIRPRNERYWIGLRKEKWIWREGGTSLELKYSNWDNLWPSTRIGDCLCLIKNTGKWKDCDCSREYRYICVQASPASTTPIRTTATTTTTTTTTTSSSSAATTEPTTHTVSHSSPTPTADDNSKNTAVNMPSGQGMLLVIGLGIACLVILIVVVAVAVFIKLRRSQSHDPGPSHDSPSTTTMTKEDAPSTVYAVVMPSQSIRSPSEKSPNKIIYAELDLVPKRNTRGTAPQELVYANTTQPDCVYANCSDTRV